MRTKSDIEKTKFNMSLSSLERLNDLLKESNYYSRLAHKRDFIALKNWYVTLVAIYKEISTKLTPKETLIVVNVFHENTKISSIRRQVRKDYGIVHQIDYQAFTKAIVLFDKIELRLRKLADEHGMLIIMEDSSAHDPDAEW